MQSDPNQQGQSGVTTSSYPRMLRAALADQVLFPGETSYEAALGGLFSSEASLARPLCIVRPRDVAQVATALKVARDLGVPVTVRGGGLSPLCAGDQAMMIDLSRHLADGVRIGNDARMGGGATMGTLLKLLAPLSRLVPVGVSPLPGMGLALRGGVGHLTRSAGLTLDHVRETEIVVASGEVLTLSDQSRGAEADLWWAVRGAGPHFGVVTSVTFRTRPEPSRCYAHRLVLPLDALPAFLELTAGLPREISASAALGPPGAAPGAPALFVYIVYAGTNGAGIDDVQELTRQLARSAGTNLLFESADTYKYHELPSYDIPALAPEGAAAATPGEPRWGELPTTPRMEQRLFKYEKCPFLKPLDAIAAAGLVDAIRSAPTPLCRIDLQHCGGALSDVAPTASAFWNRRFEWNCPVIGAWIGPDGKREACSNWVRQIMTILAPYTVGAYCVEIVPGLPETTSEVEQAYGGNLDRLRELKRKWDADQRFGLYYPL